MPQAYPEVGAVARRIVIMVGDTTPVLTEVRADNELQLQEQLKHHPDLIPIEEFGLPGPMMVVGRETSMLSGAADLLGVTPSADIVVIEFKTGPENSDFRSALAQVLDYGAQLWKGDYDRFDALAVSYFTGPHCPPNAVTKGCSSLIAAATSNWPEWPAEERDQFEQRVAANIKAGAFHYVVAAQRFRPSMEHTVAYLNAVTLTGVRCHLVEIIRFLDDHNKIEAFEARTILTAASGTRTTAPSNLSREEFLSRVTGEAFRDQLRELFEVCEAKGLTLYWGTVGMAIKLPSIDKEDGLSIGWAHPTGVKGWAGLTDLTLGVDLGSLKVRPSVTTAVQKYLTAIQGLGGTPAKASNLDARTFTPAEMLQRAADISETISNLVAWAAADQ